MSLGYQRHGDGFRCSNRKVVFVGDFVDRGPAIGEVIEISRAMVDAGDALAVMGNHEYNAIAFHTPWPGKQDEWFRPHSDKNLNQHQATLDQLTSRELTNSIAWFKTLPVAIEVGGVRVAHASWQTRDIGCIDDALEKAGRFTPDFLAISEDAGSELHTAIENVLKGPELPLPSGHSFVGNGGHTQNAIRIKWYEDGIGRTYREHLLGSGDAPDVVIDPDDLTTVDIYPRDAVPVFVGHYWLTGTPTPLAANVACTDYSVAKGGKLVAYRWDGESELSADKFHWVETE